MSTRRLDDSWIGWLNDNLRRGCDTEELLQILLKNSFDIRSIREAMGVFFPANSPTALRAENRKPDPIDYHGIANVRLTREGSGALRFAADKLQLYTLEHFMSDAECDETVALINRHLRPSTITIPSGDKSFRTSQTSDLSLLGDPLVARLDEKIAAALGIRLPYSEGIQAQRYDVGQQFKRHTDYFEPGTSEYLQYGGARGNRTWTFMVYLNDVQAGGATRFFAIDHAFAPVKGMAVVWNNLRPDGMVNPDTAHAGTPVDAGHKIIITKWFRERGIGPMFYD
jgi:prolyl 4-hydroxylase